MPVYLPEREVYFDRFRIEPADKNYPFFRAQDLTTGGLARVCAFYNAAEFLPRIRELLAGFPLVASRVLLLEALPGTENLFCAEAESTDLSLADVFTTAAPPEKVLPFLLQFGAFLQNSPVVIPAITKEELFVELSPRGPVFSGNIAAFRLLAGFENTDNMTINSPLPSVFPIMATETVLSRKGGAEKVHTSLLAHLGMHLLLGQSPYNTDRGIAAILAQAKGSVHRTWLPDPLWQVFLPALSPSSEQRPALPAFLTALRSIL